MIKLEHVQKRYGDFALDCTLEVLPGRVTALIGQNGAGKSTAFKTLLGLVRPDGGRVTLLGKDLQAFTHKDKAQLGVVLADSGFSGYLTLVDVVAILRGLYPAFDEPFFREQAAKCGLPLHKKLKEFSTGMKAKLKVLVAVSHGAKLLILDEPTAGLDVIARDELLTLLREFMEAEEGRSILISSHISADLESLCDDIYMIHGGNMVLHEETDVLLDSYAVLKVDEAMFASLDKQHLLRVKREPYGYACLTAQRQFYQENYPGIVAEKGSVDSVITLMIKGDAL